MRKTSTLLLLALAAAFPSCDKSSDPATTVEHGTSGVGSARSVVNNNVEQRIALAADLINIGQLTDAANLLNQLATTEADLPPATREKLHAVQAQLAKAQGK